MPDQSWDKREQYRRMTNSERFALTLKMMKEGCAQLVQGTPEQVDRRFELLRRQNDERNRRMLEGIARATARQKETEGQSGPVPPGIPLSGEELG